MDNCCYNKISPRAHTFSITQVRTYCDLHSFSTDKLHRAHDVLLHLDQLRQLLGKIGAESASGISAEAVAYVNVSYQDHKPMSEGRGIAVRNRRMSGSLPMLLLPKNLPALVVEDGGGGLAICDAVGARDWRMEYVRCIVVVIGE